jgi:hypothetical protein
LLRFLALTVDAARKFYQRDVEVPGYVQMSVGYLDVRDFRMHRRKYRGDSTAQPNTYRGGPFPDPTFRADIMATANELLGSIDSVFGELVNAITDGFDLERLPKEWTWSKLVEP